MTRALIIIHCDRDREKAAHWARHAPDGTRIEYKRAQRTLDQNARFWAMCTDVSEQLTWHGVRLSPPDWRLVFLDALKREVRMVPNLDGNGFVNLGRSSSDLSKEEMSDLMLLIEKFGAEHGVVFHEPVERQSA